MLYSAVLSCAVPQVTSRSAICSVSSIRRWISLTQKVLGRHFFIVHQLLPPQIISSQNPRPGLLLLENLAFMDGSHRTEIEYSFMLLLLHEPISNSPVLAGSAIMNKMMRGSDSVNLRRLISLLFRNFAAADGKASGMVPLESAQRVLREECTNIEPKHLQSLLAGFQDTGSDCVLYPEMLAFLGSCSLWNVMHRLHHIDLIRQKQGYNFQDFIVKYEKKGKKIDFVKLADQFLSLGIMTPDTAVTTIFNHYGGKTGKILDAEKFVAALQAAGSEDVAGDRTKGREITPFEVKQMKNKSDEVIQKILKDYDERVVGALECAFDLFDTKQANCIPISDLDRVLCSLGFPPNLEELGILFAKIDPGGTHLLQYNQFMMVTVEYLREQYHTHHLSSLQRLRVAFESLDVDKNGSITPDEFKYAVSVANTRPLNALTEEEIESIISFLDIDQDGLVNWDEFKQMYYFLKNEKMLETLPLTLCTALRKVCRHQTLILFMSLEDNRAFWG